MRGGREEEGMGFIKSPEGCPLGSSWTGEALSYAARTPAQVSPARTAGCTRTGALSAVLPLSPACEREWAGGADPARPFGS